MSGEMALGGELLSLIVGAYIEDVELGDEDEPLISSLLISGIDLDECADELVAKDDDDEEDVVDDGEPAG